MEDLRKYAVTYGKASSPIGTGDVEENDNDNNNDDDTDINDKRRDETDDSNNINVGARFESVDDNVAGTGPEAGTGSESISGTGPGSGGVRVLGRIVPIAKSKEINIQTFRNSLANNTEKDIFKLPLGSITNDMEITKEVEKSGVEDGKNNESIFDPRLTSDSSSLPPLHPTSTSTSSPCILSVDPAVHRNSTLNSTLKFTSATDSDLASTSYIPPCATTSFTASTPSSSSTPNAISSVMAAASTFYTTSFSTFSMSSRQLQSQTQEEEIKGVEEIEIGKVEDKEGEGGQGQCRLIVTEEKMGSLTSSGNNDKNDNNDENINDANMNGYNVAPTISSNLPLLSTASTSPSTSTAKAIPTPTQAPTTEPLEPSGQIPVPSPPIVMVPPGRIIHIYKENGKNL